jgi:hypothetical protein
MYIDIENDSKLLTGFPSIGHGDSNNNLELLSIILNATTVLIIGGLSLSLSLFLSLALQSFGP